MEIRGLGLANLNFSADLPFWVFVTKENQIFFFFCIPWLHSKAPIWNEFGVFSKYVFSLQNPSKNSAQPSKKKYFDILFMFCGVSTVWNRLSVNFRRRKSRCIFCAMCNLFCSRMLSNAKCNLAVVFGSRAPHSSQAGLHIDSKTGIQSERISQGLLTQANFLCRFTWEEAQPACEVMLTA